MQLAVGERGDAGARAPLGVVEHGVGRFAQALAPEAFGKRREACAADAVGRKLRAQVGAPLGRLAHLRDELVDRDVIEHAR